MDGLGVVVDCGLHRKIRPTQLWVMAILILFTHRQSTELRENYI